MIILAADEAETLAGRLPKLKSSASKQKQSLRTSRRPRPSCRQECMAVQTELPKSLVRTKGILAYLDHGQTKMQSMEKLMW